MVIRLLLIIHNRIILDLMYRLFWVGFWVMILSLRSGWAFLISFFGLYCESWWLGAVFLWDRWTLLECGFVMGFHWSWPVLVIRETRFCWHHIIPVVLHWVLSCSLEMSWDRILQQAEAMCWYCSYNFFSIHLKFNVFLISRRSSLTANVLIITFITVFYLPPRLSETWSILKVTQICWCDKAR